MLETLPPDPLSRKSLKSWLKGLVASERAALKACDLDTSYLYMLASGKRAASADYAAKLEAAALVIYSERPEAGYILRADVAPACAACPFFQKCGHSSSSSSEK